MEKSKIFNLEKKRAKSTVTLTDKTPQVIASTSSSKICLVCSINQADYCCPRCYKPYCSLQCYQNHDTLCTEEFFRKHVGKVLQLESQELKENNPMTHQHPLAEEFDSTKENPLNELSEEEFDNLAQKLQQSDLSSLSPMQKEKLGRVNRMMSHIHQVWTPFWRGDAEEDERKIPFQGSGGGVGKLNIERVSYLRVEMMKLRTRLITSNQSLDIPSPCFLSYQLLGALLGYVVMMRSSSGGWRTSHSIPFSNGAVSSNPESTDAVDSPLSCLQLFLQSTPLINRTFRPLSVSQTVADWMVYSTHSLPPPPPASTTSHPSTSLDTSNSVSRRTQAVRDLLVDVCRILSHNELLLYCLLDLWLLGKISELMTEKINTEMTNQLTHKLSLLACCPPSEEVSLAEIVSPLLPSPTQQQQNHQQHNQLNSKRRVDKLGETLVLYTRKVAYLFSFFLIRSYTGDESIDKWQENIFLEVQLYLSEYLSGN